MDIDAAIREFEEETGINRDNIKIYNNIFPISEEFFGSNNVKYKHIYYYAMCKDLKKVSLDINVKNKDQYNEIGDLKWLNKTQALSYIRNYEHSKIDLINKIYEFVENYDKFLGEYSMI